MTNKANYKDIKVKKSKSKHKDVVISNKLHKVTSSDKIVSKNIYHQGLKPK